MEQPESWVGTRAAFFYLRCAFSREGDGFDFLRAVAIKRAVMELCAESVWSICYTTALEKEYNKHCITPTDPMDDSE